MTAASNQPWTPEHPVSAELAERLVHRQFPEFRAARAAHIGVGWDNIVWGFDDAAFRFPQRTFGVAAIALELSALPWLATQLPLAVPAPSWIGQACDDFPYPWYGHRLLPGVSVERAGLSPQARAGLAVPVAEFLGALHSLNAREASRHGIKVNVWRSDTQRIATRISERFADLRKHGLSAFLALCEAALTDLPTSVVGEPDLERALKHPDICVTHGDFYPRHLVVEGGRAAGVIDWGDVAIGDRAQDLEMAYLLLPPEQRDAFLGAYELRTSMTLNAAVLHRARFIAGYTLGSLAAYAAECEDTTLLTDLHQSAGWLAEA